MTDATIRLLKLHEAATPGPWCVHPGDDYQEPGVEVDPGRHGITTFIAEECLQGRADAALIAAARNVLPELLDVVDALRGLRAARTCDDCYGCYGGCPCGEVCHRAVGHAELVATLALDAFDIAAGRVAT
jgi:hypothetical protein